jgi:hypothetical protein
METSNVSPLIKASLELMGNSGGRQETGFVSSAKKDGVEIA